jgi:hypothetical protein
MPCAMGLFGGRLVFGNGAHLAASTSWVSAILTARQLIAIHGIGVLNRKGRGCLFK